MSHPFDWAPGHPSQRWPVFGRNVPSTTQSQAAQAACDARRWRFNAGLENSVEAGMTTPTVAGLQAFGHCVEVLDDSDQDFGAGRFIWRLVDPAAEGCVAASEPRREGRAVAF